MNDFLRSLALNVTEVVKSERKKKIPKEAVRAIMKSLHKAEICNTDNEFHRFVHEYLPSSFTRIAFVPFKFQKKYYEFQ
jgi:hypothetical protein